MSRWDKKRPELAPFELTYRDAQAVYESEIPGSQGDHAQGRVRAWQLRMRRARRSPTTCVARLTTPDFFAMFSVPFRYGSGWDAEAESNAEPVIVLGEEANQKFFGGANSVGQTVKLDDKEYKMLGVLDHWNPVPKFYDLNNGSLDDPEDVSSFPTAAASCSRWSRPVTPIAGSPSPSTRSGSFSTPSACGFSPGSSSIQRPRSKPSSRFSMVTLPSRRSLAVFQRPLNNRLSKVSEWLQLNEVVEKDNSVLLGISFMFLAVCLLNTVGLLLAKFSGKVGVVSLHRALGASRKMIFRQHLVEVSLIGVAGGLLGIGLGFVLLLARASSTTATKRSRGSIGRWA